MLVECIKDDGYLPEHLQWLPNRPIKGDIYTVRERVHGVRGLGYLLEELHNPLMPNGVEGNFSAKRFKPVDDIDITELTEVLEHENTH